MKSPLSPFTPDDEEALAEMGQKILAGLGYRVESKTAAEKPLPSSGSTRPDSI